MANSVSPFRLFVFLPLDPSYGAQLHLQCTLSSHPKPHCSLPSPLTPPPPHFFPALQFLRCSNFFTLSCFSFSWAIELTSAFPCVLLYTCSVWTSPLSHSYPQNPHSSALFLFRRALPRVRDFFAVGMCLLLKWENMLCENRSVFLLRPQVCSSGQILL